MDKSAVIHNLYRIVMADGHCLIRHTVKKIIEKNPQLKVVDEMRDGLQLIDYLKTIDRRPDMVITAISLPNVGGIQITKKIKRHCPMIKVLILTAHKDSDYMDNAIESGADGYLLKQEVDKELFSAISTIRSGETYICQPMR